MTYAENNSDLYGLLLVGGKSSRMGFAKAYLSFHDQPQWRQGEAVLRSVSQEVFFSVSPQLSPPLSVSSSEIIDDVLLPPIGPLGGIISAFKKFPGKAFLVLACDLPWFDKEAAQYLLSRRNPEAMATSFEHEGHIEPLCTIYEASIMNHLLKSWENGLFCPRKILSSVFVEKISSLNPAWVQNINYAHEYEAWENKQSEANRLKILFYASLREAVGAHEIELATSAKTVGEIFLEIKQRYGLTIQASALRFAVNDRLVPLHEPICTNDVVVFIPPVSGG
jgi:molybdopterin-guanine dinucleotide biosynthesis protein A